MEQQPLFFEDVFDALRHVVQCAGGAKKVGHKLFPEKSPDQAGRFLMDCLNTTRAEKLDAEQIIVLLRIGHDCGCHVGVWFMSRASGYSEPDPIEPDDEMAELKRQFVQSVRTLKTLSNQIESLNGNVRSVA